MEIVGTPEIPAEKKKFPRAKGGWLKGSGTPYSPDDVFKEFEVPTEEYVKRFVGKKEYTPENSTTKESFVPGVDVTLQSPVLFREGGRFHYRWRPLRIQGMPDYIKYLESGTGRAKRSLEESGNAFEFDSGGMGGGNQFFTQTPGPADQLFNNTSVPFIQGPFCLTGDTLIPLLDGTEVTLQELAERKEDFWVYSVTPEGEIKPGRAYDARQTGTKTRIVEVLLDNGEKIRCTPEHLFMLRDGTYVPASNLESKTSLMPFYTYVSEKGLVGYELLHQPATGKWAYTHKMVTGKIPKGFVVHHINFNKRDNQPTNLMKMRREDHQTLHMNNGSWWGDPEKKKAAAEKIGIALRKNNWAKTPEGRKFRSEEMKARFARGWKKPPMSLEGKAAVVAGIRASALHKKNTAKANRERIWTSEMRKKTSDTFKKRAIENPEYHAQLIALSKKGTLARWNHKVVSVSDAGFADVYDLSVEKYDNFALTSGVFVHNSKQLYWSDYLSMHSRAFQLVNHAALAAGAVKIMTRFVLGRGVSFSIKNDQAKAIWDEFWEMNHMRHKVRQMARDLCWQGELMLRFYEREPGKISMRILDPSTCWEVVTDPEDFEHVYYYHFQWPTPYQVWTQGNIPISKYIIQQVPPTNIQHIKINISSQEKRGRSDLLPAFPWLKRFDDYYNGAIMKAILEANLVYKIKIHGDQNDLDSMSSDPNFTIMPPPGGTWLENDAVDMTPLSAMMTAGRGSSGIGQQIASIVATSLNLPTEYFNIEGGAGGARATALVRTDPAVKAVEDRQQILRESLEDLYDRVMEAALREGRIDRAAIRRDAMVVPDDGQVVDEQNPDKSLPFGGTSHSPQPVQAQPVNRTQSLPGRPVRASIRG